MSRRRNKAGCSEGSSRIIASSFHTVRILIADGHELIRAGIRALLEREHDIQVVGEADNAGDVLLESRRTKPDVMLLTYGLFSSAETETCKRLVHLLPAIRIIVLLWDAHAAAFRNAVEAGAQGILLGNIDGEKLIKAVRAAAKGDCYLDPAAVGKVFRLLRQQQEDLSLSAGLRTLSPQERRIMPLIAEGYTNKEIGVKLTLSDKTVKNYIASMFAKLEIERRTQAVALYLKAQSQRWDPGTTFKLR